MDFLSDEELDGLEKQYAPNEVPPCRVCGGELSIQAMGPGSHTVYAHARPENSEGSYREWADHYDASRVEFYNTVDFRIQQLIAEVRKYREAK